ncbi:MAG: hypothetical protein JWO60_1868, partial [Frankiales bacterium]|nr:hypothetical protein [Frankiales bacterium]
MSVSTARRRPLPLARLLARAPRLLAAPSPTALLHVGTARLSDLDAVLGLEGVERLRTDVVDRVVGLVGSAGLVARSGDVVVVVAPHGLASWLPEALGRPFDTTDRDGAPLRLTAPVRCGLVSGSAADDVRDLLDAATAA